MTDTHQWLYEAEQMLLRGKNTIDVEDRTVKKPQPKYIINKWWDVAPDFIVECCLSSWRISTMVQNKGGILKRLAPAGISSALTFFCQLCRKLGSLDAFLDSRIAGLTRSGTWWIGEQFRAENMHVGRHQWKEDDLQRQTQPRQCGSPSQLRLVLGSRALWQRADERH